MNSEKYICVGKIQSAQGVKGEVFVLIFSGEAAWQAQWKNLEVGDGKSESPQQPFKILSKRPHSKQGKTGFVLRLENVPDRNVAETLIGSRVFIPESFLVSKKGESIYLREIFGFEVIDETRGVVGVISGFSDNGAQDLIAIKDSSGKVSEVPLVRPILDRIDFDGKKVLMDIPEGLLLEEGE